MNAVN